MSSTPVTTPDLDLQSINVNFTIQYVDKTIVDTPVSGHFQDNVNLDMLNETSLNATLINKPYLLGIIPALVNVMLQGYDPENSAARALKDALRSIGGPSEE
jgi:hypothetical protein